MSNQCVPDKFNVDKANRTPTQAFKIDLQSLQEDGIPFEIGKRIQRSLYVYSVGLNQIFGELTKGSRKPTLVLVKIWNAYQQILEKCMSTDYHFLITEVATRMQEENDRLEASHFEASLRWEKEKRNMTLECERLKKQMLELKYQTDACLLEQRNLEGVIAEQKQEEVEQIELRLKSERRMQMLQVEFRKNEDQK